MLLNICIYLKEKEKKYLTRMLKKHAYIPNNIIGPVA